MGAPPWRWAWPDLVIGKDDNRTTVTPGQIVIYVLTVRNVGSGSAYGTVLSETVPAHATFYAPASSVGWSCSDGDPAGTSCKLGLGTLPAGAGPIDRLFAVRIVNPVPAGTTSIVNTASVADDGLHGADLTPGNNTDDDTDGLVLGAIGDRAWVDMNGNGIQNGAEPGLKDVTVNLYDAAGALLATTTTDANGKYGFGGLGPGSYTVGFVAPNGYLITAQDQGDRQQCRQRCRFGHRSDGADHAGGRSE